MDSLAQNVSDDACAEEESLTSDVGRWEMESSAPPVRRLTATHGGLALLCATTQTRSPLHHYEMWNDSIGRH
jgi:hypothetical protein